MLYQVADVHLFGWRWASMC